jgi:sulfane dehydrogenase subunit SoxC
MRPLVYSAGPFMAGSPTVLTPPIPQHVPGAFPRSPFEKQMRLVVSTFSTTPFQNMQGITTPSALHFERHYNGVPAIDLSRHRLNRPMMFTVEELKRFPSVSRFAFIQCSGNSRDG